MDVLDSVWEPFFGDGSEVILNSRVSHLLPIPDAALGAIGYLADAGTGAIGGKDRWRTMPWIVIVFGLAVGPFGAVSILLVVLQPVMFDAWCTLCLASAGDLGADDRPRDGRGAREPATREAHARRAARQPGASSGDSSAEEIPQEQAA
ncbi:MAG TPA: vitamin K epoxide reductase family protein [Actinomycetota bacterium]|nr:vitamin K epoxide reductase family protein [Actinomycetota bacterium]